MSISYKFGEILFDRKVAIVFGDGVNAMLGRVQEVHEDYLVINRPHSHSRDKIETFHIPFASIVYVRLDD